MLPEVPQPVEPRFTANPEDDVHGTGLSKRINNYSGNKQLRDMHAEMQ